MPNISRRDIVLLLLEIDSDKAFSKGLGGITRLQKLLYLLQKEENLLTSDDEFNFVPYKAGPYSSKLYDDLEFLENLGLIESKVTSEATEWEAAEVDLLSYEELMGDSAERADDKFVDGLGAADAYEERKYLLTDEGKKHIKHHLEKDDIQPYVDGIRRIKSKYGHHSLRDLLYYVYTKYPEMTTESEIKEKILGRRRSG